MVQVRDAGWEAGTLDAGMEEGKFGHSSEFSSKDYKEILKKFS